MIGTYKESFFLVGQLGLIFLFSRMTLREMYYFLRSRVRNDKFIFSLISVFFLPGTVIHEMSHFFMATVLFLRVHGLSIFPTFEKDHIKLGSVLYEKKDVVRGILVGIAPIVVGLLVFFLVDAAKIFPSAHFLVNVVMGYFIFTVSSTMFSSKQDLIDLIFIIPLGIIVSGAIYIFNIRIDQIVGNERIISGLESFAKKTNSFLLYSLLINLCLIIFFKSLRVIFKK